MELFETVVNSASTDSLMDVLKFLARFVLNFVVVGIIVHCFYYAKSKRRDFYFSFILVNVSTFMLIFLLGSVKLKIGFALGIFAIFGILRYRTETLPVREMTYLFAITAIAVVNALAAFSWILLLVDAIIILVTFTIERSKWIKHTSTKLVLYDKIELIVPERRDELLADLKARLGVDIKRVEVGHVDFLRDSTMLKVYYDDVPGPENSVDSVTKFPKEGE